MSLLRIEEIRVGRDKTKAFTLSIWRGKIRSRLSDRPYLENEVIIAVKAVEALNDVHLAQLLTYLKLSNCKLGMLINFNVTLIKNGIRRVANNM